MNSQRQEVNKLLEHLYIKGFSNNPIDDYLYKISLRTKEIAYQIYDILDERVLEYPKIAPDEDEALVMIWEEGTKSNILIIDGELLHFSAELEEEHYYHPKPVKFSKDKVPGILEGFLEYIQKKH